MYTEEKIVELHEKYNKNWSRIFNLYKKAGDKVTSEMIKLDPLLSAVILQDSWESTIMARRDDEEWVVNASYRNKERTKLLLEIMSEYRITIDDLNIAKYGNDWRWRHQYQFEQSVGKVSSKDLQELSVEELLVKYPNLNN